MFRTVMLAAAALAMFTLSAQAADPALSPDANTAYLKAFAAKPGIIVEPSGLEYRIIKSGFGKRPGPTDAVTCYYTGKLINGKVFDSTEPGYPANFVVNKLIPGWTEALQLMREGDHWELLIPANIAYGPRGAGDGLIPPNQTLVFDLELISTKAPPPHKPGDDGPSDGSDSDQ